MRKQIVSGMLLLLLLILPVSLYLQIERNFSLSVSNAREGALHEEAAIARALLLDIRRNSDDSLSAVRQTAVKLSQQFNADHLRILVYKDRNALTGSLPDQAALLLDAEERSTLLSSGDEALYVVHPLSGKAPVPGNKCRNPELIFSEVICLYSTPWKKPGSFSARIFSLQTAA